MILVLESPNEKVGFASMQTNAKHGEWGLRSGPGPLFQNVVDLLLEGPSPFSLMSGGYTESNQRFGNT